MLQVLLYSLPSDTYQSQPQNYGGHVEKYKPTPTSPPKDYKWKVHYNHPKLDKNIKLHTHCILLSSPPVSPIPNQGGGGIRKKRPKRKNTKRKNTKRKNTRRKSRKNTRGKSRKNTRRKNTRGKSRKNTRRKNISRISKGSRKNRRTKKSK